MPYKRKTVVPNARLSDGGLRMFEGLSPKEKETVFGYFMSHWDAAREKNVSFDEIPELPKLDRRLSNCLEALCQSADEGIAEYWRIVARNHKNAPRTEEPLDNDTLTTGKPIIHPTNKQSNQSSIQPSSHPTLEEIKAYCLEKALPADAQSFWETMERQGWQSKDGRRVEDWKALLLSWGRGKAGKTVSAQRYNQRSYTEEDLLAVSPDLIAEARQMRDTEAINQGEGNGHESGDYRSQGSPEGL